MLQTEMFLTGQEFKSNGQLSALKHAGREWIDRTLSALMEFCNRRKAIGDPMFLFEEFRETRKHDEPVSVNVWGAMPKLASKAGIIADTGEFDKSQHPAARSRIVRKWKAI